MSRYQQNESVARTCIVVLRTTIASASAAPAVECAAPALAYSIRCWTYAASPFSSAYPERSGFRYTSTQSHSAAPVSAMWRAHSSVTSVNEIFLWFAAHVPKARLTASRSSEHETNSIAMLELRPNGSSGKRGSSHSQKSGASAHEMPLPSPTSV